MHAHTRKRTISTSPAAVMSDSGAVNETGFSYFPPGNRKLALWLHLRSMQGTEKQPREGYRQLVVSQRESALGSCRQGDLVKGREDVGWSPQVSLRVGPHLASATIHPYLLENAALEPARFAGRGDEGVRYSNQAAIVPEKLQLDDICQTSNRKGKRKQDNNPAGCNTDSRWH
ncbi:hypothetical protein KIL84_022853 [Mauremys mutica]|uniref:Uncharacterized protein n=1 Tax=Mauremys mutica TaxID=74926 RepID=A0A9D3WLR4_9SAUR|nr:hypothetical protein KIL84_022853 [Mauremys mutica]